MWKIAVGFAAFAVFMLWFMFKTGADIDMGGEKHGVDSHAPAPAVAPAAPAAKP